MEDKSNHKEVVEQEILLGETEISEQQIIDDFEARMTPNKYYEEIDNIIKRKIRNFKLYASIGTIGTVVSVLWQVQNPIKIVSLVGNVILLRMSYEEYNASKKFKYCKQQLIDDDLKLKQLKEELCLENNKLNKLKKEYSNLNEELLEKNSDNSDYKVYCKNSENLHQ